MDRITYHEKMQSLDRLSRFLSKIINIVAGVLLATYGWLEFQNAPIDKITNVFDSNSFTKFGLAIFVAGWALGATDDTKIQRKCYAIDPLDGRLELKQWIAIVIFIAMFAFLIYVHEIPVLFQFSLLVFILINIWTYSSVIMKRTDEMLKKSAEFLIKEKENIEYLKLFVGVEYLKGNWQKRRFIFLLILAVIQLVVSLIIYFNLIPSHVSGLIISGVGMDKIIAYLPSFLFLVYAIISEAWIKIYRFKVFSDFETIDQIDLYFNVSKKRGIELPEINKNHLFSNVVNKHTSYQ